VPLTILTPPNVRGPALTGISVAKSSLFLDIAVNFDTPATKRPLRTRGALSLPGGHLQPIRTLELDARSVSVLADVNIPKGTSCKLNFHVLNNGRSMPVNASAIVQYSIFQADSVKLELSITDIDDSSRTAITGFLNERR
jgi:hypothetical protein